MSYFLRSRFNLRFDNLFDYLSGYSKNFLKSPRDVNVKNSVRYLRLLPILISSSLILGGCQANNQSKNDCNRLIQVTNSAKTLSIPKASAEFITLAKGLEQLNLKVRAIVIEDLKLKEFKTQFSQLYLGTARGARQVSQANLTRDRNLSNEAQKNLKALIIKEQSLVVALNQYCEKS